MADRPKTVVRLSERLALSVSEAAKAVGVSERLMRTILPDIPHLRIGGRVVIPRDQLVEWMRSEVDRERNHTDEIARKVVEAVTRD